MRTPASPPSAMTCRYSAAVVRVVKLRLKSERRIYEAGGQEASVWNSSSEKYIRVHQDIWRPKSNRSASPLRNHETAKAQTDSTSHM
jgi:hypothetical protein